MADNNTSSESQSDNGEATTFSLQHPRMDFVDALGGSGRAMLYVQSRLLLTRVCRAVSGDGWLRRELSSQVSNPMEVQLAADLSLLLAGCHLPLLGSSTGLLGVRLLRRLDCWHSGGGWKAVDALLRCLRTAITAEMPSLSSTDASAVASGQSVWQDCLKFAAYADGSYGMIKCEIRGSQHFFQQESRILQKALVLLDGQLQLGREEP